MRFKQIISKVFCIILGLGILCSCSVFYGLPAVRGTDAQKADADPDVDTPEEAPESTLEPPPAPTPEPTPEPELPAGRPVTVDGTELAGGSVVKNEVEYVRMPEMAAALGIELTDTEDGGAAFTWRKENLTLSPDQTELTYKGETFSLAGPVTKYHGELCVPVESLCDALDISQFYDEEYNMVYYTPGAGDWSLAEGYNVPVIMYHGVSDDTWTMINLFMSPDTMRSHIEWLLDNGYEPIFFEDLWHVEDYEKPVILTFDDGWDCMYTELLPILQEYQVKATVFIITNNTEDSATNPYNRFVQWSEVREMQDTGLVSVQSHTKTHTALTICRRETQEKEMADAKLAIIRNTGKEPFVLAYPEGKADGNSYELAGIYYRFAVMMHQASGKSYVTGDDPTQIWRLYVQRKDGVDQFAEIMNRSRT